MTRDGIETNKIVKELRTRMGLTQEELAAEIGVTVSTVNRWENSRSKPNRLALRRIEELKAKHDRKRKR